MLYCSLEIPRFKNKIASLSVEHLILNLFQQNKKNKKTSKKMSSICLLSYQAAFTNLESYSSLMIKKIFVHLLKIGIYVKRDMARDKVGSGERLNNLPNFSLQSMKGYMSLSNNFIFG